MKERGELIKGGSWWGDVGWIQSGEGSGVRAGRRGGQGWREGQFIRRGDGRERREFLTNGATCSVKQEVALAGYWHPWGKSLAGGGGDEEHTLLTAGKTVDKGPAA